MKQSTHQKALRINLDGATHGTFAEIGAGQEVARWFFAVGGAAATVAKTISAYDMAVSDAIYGAAGRYVSRQRLSAILDREYALLLEQLDGKRGADTAFFVFADTVATRSHSRHLDGHGWLGMRFQYKPGAETSQVSVHVRMLDSDNVREQEALGIIGVNLIHGAFYQRDDPPGLIASLMDGLTPERIEIDMIRFSGPCFTPVDNRLMSLRLVEQDFTRAAMFSADGEVLQAADALYKKPVLVLRGSFRPVTKLVMDMLDKSVAQFQEMLDGSGEPPVVLMEMSLQDLMADERVDHDDFLERADVLGTLGKAVLITRFAHDYRLVPYLRRYTAEPIAFAMGAPAMRELFQEKYYDALGGGVLKAVGELFSGDVTAFIYPSRDPDTGQIETSDKVKLAPHLRHLYGHLLENKLLQPIHDAYAEYLDVLPRDVLAKIRESDSSWETMVPPAVVERVKERKLFGYQGECHA